ncbi:hypothetical protein PVK06_019286 [Gossypium arboreum]|uniref:Reverse transcriptase n=1 Tax=Gossypium arboreum TaxID=29729 RepID=A0ABR0PJM7_GOSAR|nr:hypothetical protein PVK06_019286 [Gossypium arboreum]
MTGSGPSLSHLFFVDDLVIFGKVNVNQANLIKDLLSSFCGFSRHWVNAHKMNIFFSKGVEDDLVGHLCDKLGFRMVHNLGSYLRVPLFYQRVTISSLKFVMVKVKSRCWRDNWIPKIGPLINLIPTSANIIMDCCLKEMTTDEGRWNLKLFQLLTHVKQLRRSVDSDARCLICGHETDDVLHAIRDCVATKNVWSRIIPPHKVALLLVEYLEIIMANGYLASTAHWYKEDNKIEL